MTVGTDSVACGCPIPASNQLFSSAGKALIGSNAWLEVHRARSGRSGTERIAKEANFDFRHRLPMVIRMNRTTFTFVSLLAVLLGACALKRAPGVAPAGPHYRVVAQWGKPGKGPRQFDRMEGLAVDSKGTVYVADAGNYRVQVFSGKGRFLRAWRACGEECGELCKPVDIAVGKDGTVYVADYHGDRIYRFTADGTLLTAWGEHGDAPGEFHFPSGLEIDNEGRVYVADSHNHRIQVFDPEGNFLYQFGAEGHGDGQLYFPTDLVITDRHEVYIADTHNFRVQKFALRGDFLETFGSEGKELAQFVLPTGVAVDKWGNIHVADSGNYRVQLFSSNWELLGHWSLEKNYQHPELNSPVRVAVQGEYVYLSDLITNRIIRLRVVRPTK